MRHPETYREAVRELCEKTRALLDFAEDCVDQIENKWGGGRTLDQMEEDSDLPTEIEDARAALARAEAAGCCQSVATAQSSPKTDKEPQDASSWGSLV